MDLGSPCVRFCKKKKKKIAGSNFLTSQQTKKDTYLHIIIILLCLIEYFYLQITGPTQSIGDLRNLSTFKNRSVECK